MKGREHRIERNELQSRNPTRPAKSLFLQDDELFRWTGYSNPKKANINEGDDVAVVVEVERMEGSGEGKRWEGKRERETRQVSLPRQSLSSLEN